ncbi:PP2C family protein-serine/threonine phosphatase [Streptomyces sp. DSM 42041]|uniref:PP2C family protein-serine/threonine phosphatase n=1 Tax=Streptomyces hazeniae TaxID=3075538 RepID=A0ABU2NR99_9ACTN|nr:PP2C family protein-serine/threonine phosphatase [Streptomyces sp. DSM 42041]MDT0379270.1 PP2C family protein-serine/threonine phosphatase [Streptomyces sp. DSM 42041]
MTPSATALLATLPDVRRAVRRLARLHGLPAEQRARLTLSVALVARRETEAGRGVRLTAEVGPHREAGPGVLTVTLDAGLARERAVPVRLPLSAETVADGRTVWRLPLTADPDRPAVVDGADGEGDEEAAEEELRAVLDRADSLAADHRRLTHELDETNSGVLALYVELEERDEQLRSAHGRILRELEDALRPPPLTVPGLELAVHYAPADTHAPTGGDLYDWFTLPDGTVHITVVDALGHGVRSTRDALNVTHAVRTLALEGHPPATLVERAGEIVSGVDAETMATVLLARLDPATGHLSLANGSHPPALLVRRDGTTEYLEVRGRGVGFPLPGSEGTLTVGLAPGDLVLLYTDGLTESRRDPVEGEARLVTAAVEHRERPIEEVPGAVADAMHTVVLHPDDTLALAMRLPLKGG